MRFNSTMNELLMLYVFIYKMCLKKKKKLNPTDLPSRHCCVFLTNLLVGEVKDLQTTWVGGMCCL